MRHVLLGLLLAGVVAAYSNTLAVPFLLDDFATIPGNPSITKFSPITSVLFPPPNVYSAGRPVLNISFAVNYALGGTTVGGYHVVNLAIHLGATAVVFGLLRRALLLPRIRERFPAGGLLAVFLITGLWALHPLQTVSVTYISQRAESLMGLFYLLTVYAFVRSVRGDSVLWKTVSIAACALGMATKEVMVTAPVLVFLFDVTCVTGEFKRTWAERRWYYVALCSTWLVLGALMIHSQLGERAVGVEQGITRFNYARMECYAVGRYLWLSIWPSSLVFDYGANLPLPDWRAVLAPALVLCVLAGAAIRQIIRCRISGFLGSAFLVLLAPTSSIVPIAGQPIAENRMYLPLLLVLIGVVAGVALAASRRSYVALILATAGVGCLARERNAVFQSGISIWRDTVEKQPVNERAWVFLSEAFRVAGKTDEAIEALLKAVRYRPYSAELENNAGVALFAAGRAAESIGHLEAAIRLNPNLADAHYNLGVTLYRTEKIAAALERFESFLKLRPNSAEAWNYAGLCQLRLGSPAAAVSYFRRATDIDPAHIDARSNLEFALARRK